MPLDGVTGFPSCAKTNISNFQFDQDRGPNSSLNIVIFVYLSFSLLSLGTKHLSEANFTSVVLDRLRRSLNRHYRTFLLPRKQKKIENPISGYSQEIVTILGLNKEDTSPSFRSTRFPKPQIFVEISRAQYGNAMLVHITWCKHLELTLAI